MQAVVCIHLFSVFLKGVVMLSFFLITALNTAFYVLITSILYYQCYHTFYSVLQTH